MELYHFTSPDRADAIAAQGLEPRNECRRDCATSTLTGLLYWPRDCVWLTRNGREIPTVWGSFDKCRRILIVRIPAADKRLISFVRWMREQMPEELAEHTARTLDKDVLTPIGDHRGSILERYCRTEFEPWSTSISHMPKPERPYEIRSGVGQGHPVTRRLSDSVL
jgi:hypothetical protein